MPTTDLNLDALLAGAKSTLANADAFNNQYVSDVNQAALDSAADDRAQETHPLSDFLSGAGEGVRNVASKFGNAALGLGELLTSNPADVGARAGEDIWRESTLRGPEAGAMTAADMVTGLPVSAISRDVQAGDWGDLAANVGVGATLGALFHRMGAGPKEMGASPIEPRIFGPSRTPELLSTRPLPQTRVRVPDTTAGYGYTDAGEGLPLAADLHASDSPVDRYLPNQSAAAPSRPVAENGISAQEVSAPVSEPTAEGESTTPGGNFTWDLSDFADQPAGSVVKDFTTDANGSTIEAVPSRPKLSASEVSQMLHGREKFATANPDATLAPGMQDELDRMGVEYGRTQSALKRLLGMDTADRSPEDAADLPRYQQAARELGARLRQTAKSAATPAPPEAPPSAPSEPPSAPSSLEEMLNASIAKQEADRAAAVASAPPDREGHFALPQAHVSDDAFAKAADAVNSVMARKGLTPQDVARLVPDTVSRPLSTPAPASVSPLRDFEPVSDTTDITPSPLSRLLTEETGSVNPQAVVDAARAPIDWQRGADIAHDVQIGNMVSGPSTLAKIGVSNLGSLFAKAIENSARDRSLAPLTNTARALTNVPAMASDFMDALKNERAPSRLELETTPPNALQRVSRLLTRPVGAMDAVFRGIADRAGMTPDEASQIVQQQTPSTPFAQAALRLQRTVPGKILAPIMRSPLNLLGSGVWEPMKAAERLRTGTSENAGQDIAKVVLAAGATAVGATGASTVDQLPYWLRPLALASAGYYSIPMSVAYAIAHAPSEGLRAGMTEAIRSVPLAQGLSPDLGNLLSRLVPGPIRQANPDYWTGTKRDAKGLVQQLQAKFPGLAQMLAVKQKKGGGGALAGVDLPPLPSIPQ